MKNITSTIAAAVLAIGLAAPLAHADWSDVRREHRDLSNDNRALAHDRQEYYDARRRGDRDEMDEERQEMRGRWNDIRRDRAELGNEIRDARRDDAYDRSWHSYRHDDDSWYSPYRYGWYHRDWDR